MIGFFVRTAEAVLLRMTGLGILIEFGTNTRQHSVSRVSRTFSFNKNE